MVNLCDLICLKECKRERAACFENSVFLVMRTHVDAMLRVHTKIGQHNYNEERRILFFFFLPLLLFPLFSLSVRPDIDILQLRPPSSSGILLRPNPNYSRG